MPIQGLRRTCRNHARAYLAKHNPKTIFLVGQTHLLLELEDHETPVIIVEPVAKTNQQAMASCKNTRHIRVISADTTRMKTKNTCGK